MSHPGPQCDGYELEPNPEDTVIIKDPFSADTIKRNKRSLEQYLDARIALWEARKRESESLPQAIRAADMMILELGLAKQQLTIITLNDMLEGKYS